MAVIPDVITLRVKLELDDERSQEIIDLFRAQQAARDSEQQIDRRVFQHARYWREAQPKLLEIKDQMERASQTPSIINTDIGDSLRDWVRRLSAVCS